MCQERDDVKRCEEPAILDWECFLFCGYHMLELNELKPGREENNPNIPPAEMRRLLKQYGHEFQPQAPPPSDISNKELRELFSGGIQVSVTSSAETKSTIVGFHR